MRRRARRHLPAVAWTTLVWVALWGDLSWANLLGGLAVSVVVLTAVRMPPSGTARRVRAVPALVYGAVFLRDLAVATAEVARQVLWPVDRLRPAVLEVPLVSRDPALLSLVANTITLTPGTLTLEVDIDRGLLWVHVLHLGEGGGPDVAEGARGLERLGARALGIDLDAAVPRGTRAGGTS